MKCECFIYHISTKLKQNDHSLTKMEIIISGLPFYTKIVWLVLLFVFKFCQETSDMISGPSWMQILVGCSVGRPIMHPSHRSTNLYFSASLQPIEWESVILTGKFGDALRLLGHFQTGRHKDIRKAKNGIFHIPTSNHHRYTNFVAKDMCLRVQNMIK